jgi:predicted kinase
MIMSQFKLKTQTVVLLVGPSGCGKSYFSKNNLIPALKTAFLGKLPHLSNIQYLSSDDIRRELLGDPNITYGKNTPQMQAASEQAFNFLYHKLELVTSYPINAEMVIVDTTGLNLAFRNKITKIARDANYTTACVVFGYKERNDYYKYLDETHDLAIVSDHIKRLNRQVMAELRKKDFDSYFYIRKKDFSDIEIVVEDVDDYASHFISPNFEYPIIGDIHGCYDELLALLEQLRFTIEDGKIVESPSHKIPIVIGDFIDGSNLEGIEKTINFLYENRKYFKLVTGNHENFVYRHYKKDLDPKAFPPAELMDNHFQTIPLLEKDPTLADKFCVLKEESRDFLIGHNFIVTHSPCEESVLGKMHPTARRQQRNFRYPHRLEGEELPFFSKRFEDALVFLKNAATTNKPYHVFGHCRCKNVARIKNKIGIDTGCSQGNRLTAVSIVGNKVYFNCIAAKCKPNEELPEIFTRKDAATEIIEDVNLKELDPKELSRIKRSAKNKINFISGTMSPSDKDLGKFQLESIEKALEYFKNKEVDSVCLQPKYMGSRCEVMINCQDLVQSYSSTRRGYLIDHVDLKEAYEKLLPKVKPFADEGGFEWLYLDCELMPWYTLGKGLIEYQYSPCRAGIASEINLLKETGFEDRLLALVEEAKNVTHENSVGYAKLSSQIARKQLQELLSHHKCANYDAIKDFKWISLEEQAKYFEVYKRQLELYATAGETHFKPFSLLKGIRPNGSEQLFFDMPNSEQFHLVSDDECLVVDLESKTALEDAEAFFDKIVAQDLEGCVMKPQQPYIKGVAPFMKIRNPNYLTIIYSYDYLHPFKYGKLVRQKGIDRKLRASIDQFEYGKRMLEIPRSEISIDNQAYLGLFSKLIFEEKKEESFDPRL